MMQLNYFKNHYHIIATTLFIIAIAVAHIFATQNYQWTKNTISDLGSQGYDRKFIMQFGFLAFGITLTTGIFLNGLTLRTTPIVVYSLCVGFTGIFCTKPFFNINNYAVMQDAIHSTMAQMAGIAFTMGILVQMFYAADQNEKWIHFAFFILVIILSACFGLTKNYQGIAQRLLYLTSFIWLIKFYKP